jgi:hypothetical protein
MNMFARNVILMFVCALLCSCGSSAPSISPLLHLAQYVQPGQLNASTTIDASSINGYDAVISRTQDLAASYAGATTNSEGTSSHAFTVASPEGDFTFQVTPLNLTFMGQNQLATANVYTIQQNGDSITWGEVNVVINGSISSMVVLGQPDGSTQIETSNDLLAQIQSGPPLHTQGNGSQSPTCGLVESGCTTVLDFGKNVLCAGQTIDVALEIVSCVGILFTDGASIDACMITIVEGSIAAPFCGKLAGIIEDAAGNAACDAIVGCNPLLGFLGCDCGWKNPCGETVQSACGALVNAAICEGSNAVASGLVSSSDIAEEVCSDDPTCSTLWDTVCSALADNKAAATAETDCENKYAGVCGGQTCGADGTSCSGNGDCCNQDCNGGVCGPASTCTSDAYEACAANGNLYWYDSCGNQEELAQNCNGCGCSENSCSSCGPTCTSDSYKACSGGNLYWYDSCGNQQGLVQNCNGCGCSGGSCSSCGPTCTSDSYKACSGGNLYWYDSCGNQQGLVQNCNGCGCSGGSCSSCGPTCTSDSYKACSSGNLYWYDSCGNQQGLAQSCNGCGCSGGSCSSCQMCTDQYIYSTTRSCGSQYCARIVSVNSTTTTVEISKADNSSFGDFSLIWTILANGSVVDEYPFAFCGDSWNGLSAVQKSFPTSSLNLSVGASTSISATLWVGPQQNSCTNSSPTGSVQVSYLCQ